MTCLVPRIRLARDADVDAHAPAAAAAAAAAADGVAAEPAYDAIDFHGARWVGPLCRVRGVHSCRLVRLCLHPRLYLLLTRDCFFVYYPERPTGPRIRVAPRVSVALAARNHELAQG